MVFASEVVQGDQVFKEQLCTSTISGDVRSGGSEQGIRFDLNREQ